MPETEGPPKNAGEVSCPRPGLGTQHPQTPPPLRMKDRGENHVVFLHSAVLASLLNVSADGFYIFFFCLYVTLWLSLGHCLGVSLHVWFLPHPHSLPSWVHFLSSVHISLRGIDYKQSCGLACGQELIQWFPKRNDIIVRFVVQIVEWQ